MSILRNAFSHFSYENTHAHLSRYPMVTDRVFEPLQLYFIGRTMSTIRNVQIIVEHLDTNKQVTPLSVLHFYVTL